MKRSTILSLALAALAMLVPGLVHADEAGEAAIRKTLHEYAEAYNKHDAAAAGTFWAENATHIDRVTGDRTEGRAAIQADLAAYFESNPDTKLSAEIDSIRNITDQVAVVEGRSFINVEGADPEISNFSVIVAKSGDKWQLNTAEELPASPVSPSNLKDLESLVGKWVDSSPEERIETEFRWSNSGNFLLRSFTCHRPEGSESLGTQIIGWDPREQQIRSWSFHSDGSFSEATWSRSGSAWTTNTTSTLADGRTATGTYVMTPVDEKTMTIQLIAHTIDGAPQPTNDPVTLVRESTEAEPQTPEPASK